MNSRAHLLTEQALPESLNLDSMSIKDAIALMNRHDALAQSAVAAESASIARAIGLVVTALENDGRLIYFGAGTSGRLGMLDAAECPPTFRLPPERVQGIIAGGQTALWRSVEGAEDSAQAGASASTWRGVNERDVVFGIAASGRTPFVWGALNAAKERGARTVLLCFNPKLEIPKSDVVSRRASKISPMPEGLADSLTEDEIWDLIAYLKGGKP